MMSAFSGTSFRSYVVTLVEKDRLREKGYNCRLEAVNEKREVNFVNDFLKKDMPTAGQLHRYSFDMRA